MIDRELLNLSDFEWASVARYIVYISSIANLKEVNTSHVHSFPLGRLGPKKLLKQKERILGVLEANKACIERFVGEHKGELDEGEMAILRTLYIQYRGNAEQVTGHIDAIRVFEVERQMFSAEVGEVTEDEELY